MNIWNAAGSENLTHSTLSMLKRTGSKPTEGVDDWNPRSPPPPGILLRNGRKNGSEEVTLSSAPMPQTLAVFSAMVALFAGLLGYAHGSGLAASLMMLISGGLFIFLLLHQLRTRWSITILPGKFIVRNAPAWYAADNNVCIPFHEVESISLQSLDRESSEVVVIKTIRSSIELAVGRRANAARWLKNYLIMEFAGLTWRPISGSAKPNLTGEQAPPNPVMLKPDLAIRLISLFLSCAPEAYRKLAVAISANDAQEARRQAHWLKSASANVGAHHVSEICQLLEKYARQGEWQRTQLLFTKLEATLPGVEDWLRDLQSNAKDKIVDALLAGDPTKSNPIPTTENMAVSDHRVLVVDDSPLSREIAYDYLSELVARIDFAGDGREAVDKWRTEQYDLIFMDCEMIQMDGFEATKVIRREESELQRPRTPIVALTGHVLTDYRDRCFAAGMDDYISKPYPPKALQQALQKWIWPTSPRGCATQPQMDAVCS